MKQITGFGNYISTFLLGSVSDIRGLTNGKADFRYFIFRIIIRIIHVSALFWLANVYLDFVFKFLSRVITHPQIYIVIETAILFTLYILSGIIFRYTSKKGHFEKIMTDEEIKERLKKYNLLEEFYTGLIFLSLVYILSMGIWVSTHFVNYPYTIYQP